MLTVENRLWRVTVANGTHTVTAPSALEACEQAQERWGTWPSHIERFEGES